MYFKIVEKFGPSSGVKWQEYLDWRKANFLQFDSVDSSIRPDLFSPESQEDWDNCVNEDYKINLITNLDYAKKVFMQKDDSCLVGVEIELEGLPRDLFGILGFDIIDEYCATSLLTNWGVDDLSFINEVLGANGLIEKFKDALRIRDLLRDQFEGDSHAGSCSIWAIYSVLT